MKLYCPECETRYEGDKYQNCPDDGARLFRLDSEEKKGDPLIGAVIDSRFRIDELIGAGGMGAVYRAVQLSVNRDVALKVLRAELADEEVALERFFREAKVVSKLSHPNIVRLVDFGRDDGHDLLYLVMEMVRGMDLGDLLYRGRLQPNLALEVVYQTCGALTEPHARGIVHRDLKPENLIIVPISDGTFQVKVLDFGIARALEGGATQLTKTGMICGTPSYMSPEQAQNEEMDGRTDLYALGVILFEMLTGEPPFSGDTSLQVLLNHIRKPAPALDQLIPSELVAGPICELVGDLLAKDLQHRPASARAVRDRIDGIRHQLQLEPVRLKRDADGEDAFKEWICNPLGFTDADGNFSVDSQEELPASQTTDEAAGVEIHQTEEALEPAESTDESEEPVRVTEDEDSMGAPVAERGLTAEVEAAQSEELSVASGAYETTTTEVVDEARSGGKRMMLIGGGLGLIAALCVASGVVGYLVFDDYFEDEEGMAQIIAEEDSEESGDEIDSSDEGDRSEADELEPDDAEEDRGDEESPEDSESDEEEQDEGQEDVVVEMDIEPTETVEPADEEEDDASEDTGGDRERDRGRGQPRVVDEPDEETAPSVPDDDIEEASDEAQLEVPEMEPPEEIEESPEPEEQPQEESDEVEVQEDDDEQDDVRDRLRRLRSD